MHIPHPPISLLLPTLLILTLLTFATPCVLHGTDSGYCDQRYHPSYYSIDPTSEIEWMDNSLGGRKNLLREASYHWNANRDRDSVVDGGCGNGDGDSCMDFCGNYLFDYKAHQNSYIPCVPKKSALPVSRDFPEGRFREHTVRSKDEWVRDFVGPFIRERIRLETNSRNIDDGVDEHGNTGETAVRFSENPDCRQAYTAFICWVNFPRCNLETQQTLPMCKSACENMFSVCGYSEDMWRCGDAEFFNAYSAETPGGTSKHGMKVSPWKRDFFPGQPFKKNEFYGGEDPRQPIIDVCTPSFFGAARSFGRMGVDFSVAILFVIITVLGSVGCWFV